MKSYNKIHGQVGKWRFKETGGTAIMETHKDRIFRLYIVIGFIIIIGILVLINYWKHT